MKRVEYLEQMADTVAEVLRDEPWTTDPHASHGGSSNLLGASSEIAKVRDLILRYASADACVLITGETGTGKDVVAEELHQAGARARRPFVAVNCGAIAGPLFESEVFGSVRGAYTGSVASRTGLVGEAAGGTLFLDEVGELPREAQSKLLRLLEDGSYRPVGASREKRADVRIIAATNRDLREATEAGEFRQDLYYRLAVLRIMLPPLRSRRGDIVLLAEHFLSELGRGNARWFAGPALEQLLAWPWPGNVRELKHVVERTLLTTCRDSITCIDFGDESMHVPGSRLRRQVSAPELIELLVRCHGRLGPVSRELGVSIRTVQRRMKELQLHVLDFRPGRGKSTATRRLHLQ